jgi:hypothetical protein
MTRTEEALAQLNAEINLEGNEIWDVIGPVARAHGITEKTLLAAYDRQFEEAE